MVTEIGKLRSKNDIKDWPRWLLFLASFLLFFGSQMPSYSGSAVATPGFVMMTVSGSVLTAWLSLVCFVQACRLRDRKLHRELVREIDALRQELDKLKSFR